MSDSQSQPSPKDTVPSPTRPSPKAPVPSPTRPSPKAPVPSPAQPPAVPPDWPGELEHFTLVRKIIAENILRSEAECRQRHAQVQELYRRINGGDVELYNQLMTAASLEEHALSSLRKNRAALEKPYFGRIDYEEASAPVPQQVYIGKNGVFRDRTEVLIADWRSPIASVYYENELGPGEYGLPDEAPIPIDLKGKRTYDVEGGVLRGCYDSDVAANDALLIQYLSRNRDAVLGEIIATIQKEQNAIIRESPFANLIVQGVAGSGKTTVAMHRISYLLYNYRHRFESNEYCIVGSSDLLLNYITAGLPELDVPNIRHLRMDQLFARLCEKDWSPKYRTVPPDGSAPRRCSLEFMRELELFLAQKREQYIDCSPLEDPQLGVILPASGTRTLLRENPAVSVCTLLSMLDERAKTRIRFLLAGCDRDEIQKKLREYAGHYRSLRPRTNARALYLEFLESMQEKICQASPGPEAGRESREALRAHLAALGRKEWDLYDMAALALIHYRIFQKEPNQAFGLLFLDEAQDFGIGAYYVLRQLLPASYFTVMGDVSQNINYDTGLNDWYELQKLFLTGPKDKFLLLQKSYRNTIEISRYAGQILEHANGGRYRIEPVIRHGLPVSEKSFWSDLEMAQYAASLIGEIRSRGHRTVAVICREQADEKHARELLSPLTPLREGENENFAEGTTVLPIRLVKGLEFDAVILWNLRLEQNLSSPREAKLFYVAATRALHELHVLSC